MKNYSASKVSLPFPKKLLIITYYWPPCGGAGVQRWLKFAKYLPEYGWEPVILTVDPEFASYPALDTTLERDIDPETRVFKTRATDYFRLLGGKSGTTATTSAGFASDGSSGFFGKLARFIRGNFFIPDPRRGWNSYAYKKACSVISDLGINYVITTGPPHSTHLVGLKLKRRYPELKWIADFRDPWTDIYYYKMFYHSPPARMIDMGYEKSVLNSADLILSVGESLTKLLKKKVENPKNKFITITNGYDEADFKELSYHKKSGTLYITYVGTISEHYPIEGFILALKKLIEKGERKVIFRLVGNISDRQKLQVFSSLPADNTDFIPYADHKLALQYMIESNLLLLVIPDHPLNNLIMTGKLFEYLRSGTPIICLGPPNGDAANIISEAGAGEAFEYYKLKDIEQYITSDFVGNPTPYDSKKWDRKYLSKHLSDYLILLK